MEAFEFIFRLYNFCNLCEDISNQFSNDAAHVLSFVAKRAKSYPPLPPGACPDNNTNTSSPTTQSESVTSGIHINVSGIEGSTIPTDDLQEGPVEGSREGYDSELGEVKDEVENQQ